jgi:type IV secretory pathway TrbL component
MPTAKPEGGANMLISGGTPQNLDSVKAVILASTVVAVIFWRHAIRIVLTLVAIVFAVLTISGAILIYQVMHHIPK